MASAMNLQAQIEELTEQVREELSAGFYPEEYHHFCRRVEEKLDKIDELAYELVQKIQDNIKD